MMVLWNEVVEILRESILAYAHVCHGSLGAGILVVTFLVRLALAPLVIRLARIAAQQQEVSPFSSLGCLGTLVPAPAFIALYSSVRQAATIGGRFLWIRDLAKPDWALAIIATGVTCLATVSGGAPSQNRSVLLTMSAVITIAALAKMAAGVGLYWGLSSLFSAAQGWTVQRLQRRPA
jgi:membrane protein insertase Oxa1/YidC/SpoIIIJ